MRQIFIFQDRRTLLPTLTAEGRMEAAFTKASTEAQQVSFFLLTQAKDLIQTVNLSLVLSGQLKS